MNLASFILWTAAISLAASAVACAAVAHLCTSLRKNDD